MDRSITRHKNFMSLEIPQPFSTSANSERKTSVTIERPIINLDPPKDSPKRNSAVVEAVRACALARGGGSRSFEQPIINDKPKTKRMCTSLDVTPCVRLESGDSLIVEEADKDSVDREDEKDESSSLSVSMEEGRINAPLLESLKSSDV